MGTQENKPKPEVSPTAFLYGEQGQYNPGDATAAYNNVVAGYQRLYEKINSQRNDFLDYQEVADNELKELSERLRVIECRLNQGIVAKLFRIIFGK